MERHLKLADLEATVKNVYQKYKDLDADGAVDSRVSEADASKFGIAVTLTDGRTVTVGDVDVASPLGSISLIPAVTVLRQQKLDKAEKCHCDKNGIKMPVKNRAKGLPISGKAIRLVSKIQPQGDEVGKYGVIEDMTEAMMGTAPTFDDSLYKALVKANEDAGVENALAAAGFELYDSAPIAIDTYTKMEALQATASQLAMLGATLAADGRNPQNGQYAFDGEVAPRVVAYMAAHGPHKLSKPWLVKSGLPAKSSWGGAMLGVYPGVMAIAAYSPVVNETGVSVKAYKALHHIMKDLGLSVFDSAKIVID